MNDFDAVAQSTRDFMRGEVAPLAAEWDRNRCISAWYLKKATDLGLHILNVEKEYGGLGLTYGQSAALKEEMGWADVALTVKLCASALSYIPLSLAGTEDQRKRMGAIMHNGGLGAFCLTEPQGGSDATQCKVTARRVGSEYVLNGVKSLIINGGDAEVYMVIAVTDPTAGPKGISAFMVERSRCGIHSDPPDETLGICAAGACEVHFEDVVVPASNLVGREGVGFGLAMQGLDRSRPGVGSVAVGLSQRALDEAVSYAKERVAFGKPIAKHQALSFIMADMEIRTQAARQLVRHANELIDSGDARSAVSSAAKAFAGDAAVQTALDAVQILGGYGYCKDSPVEKLLRDAKIFQIFEGTNEIQRIIVAGDLLR